MSSSPPRRPLTILQIIPTLVTGGAERTTIDIAAALAARGDRALVASAGGRRLLDELKAAGGIFLQMPVDWKNPVAIATNIRRIERVILGEGVDLVHARSRAPAWSALAACRRCGVPLVTTYHGVYNETNRLKRLYNSVMVRGAAVIANSRYTADLIGARYGTPSQKVVVIPRSVDLRRFDPAVVDPVRRNELRQAWGIGRGARIVLNLARLTGWKGQRVLIEAAALLPETTDAIVVLAGDDQGRTGYRKALEELIRHRGLENRVRIVGHCADPPAAFALSDVAVLASTEPEAFGRAAIEASAMGVPVVATALGATAETVLSPPVADAGRRTGWLVPAGDPAALAASIAEALALSPAERAALALRARAHAVHFGVDRLQRDTLALYDRLLAAGTATQS